MLSELYRATVAHDIDLVRALIATSPAKWKINQLENNGTTALHAACRSGDPCLVKIFVEEFHVPRNQKDRNGQTAYEVSSEEIRQVFRRPPVNGNRFCTDENVVNPMEVFERCNIDHSTHWLDHLPNQHPILSDLFSEMLNDQSRPIRGIFEWFRSLFSADRGKEKLIRWSSIIQFYLDDHFKRSGRDYDKTCELLDRFVETEDINHLFTLYTFSQSFCEYLAAEHERTQCFYLPFKELGYLVERRSHQGESYRGLSMTADALSQYTRAWERKGSYIKTKTFCSSSKDRSVAVPFSEAATNNPNLHQIVITFHFDDSCPTAIRLYPTPDDPSLLSQFEGEDEILILPNTYFSVEDIGRYTNSNIVEIHLKYFDTVAESAQMHQDRFKSYIDSIILD